MKKYYKRLYYYKFILAIRLSKAGLIHRLFAPLIVIIAISLTISSTAHSSELTAIQLQEYCAEMENAFIGKKFDATKAENCKGYILGFFDTMIVADQFAGKPQICVPASLPKTQNSLILNAWIKQNEKIAAKTTAAVALFSAYAKAFPCK